MINGVYPSGYTKLDMKQLKGGEIKSVSGKEMVGLLQDEINKKICIILLVNSS